MNNNSQVYSAREYIEKPKNNPQVYTTKVGREDINYLYRATQEGIEEFKNNPQVYTIPGGIEEIKKALGIHSKVGKKDIKNSFQVYTTQEVKEDIKSNPRVSTTDALLSNHRQKNAVVVCRYTS